MLLAAATTLRRNRTGPDEVEILPTKWLPFVVAWHLLLHLPEQLRERLADQRRLAALLQMKNRVAPGIARYLSDRIHVHNRCPMDLPELRRIELLEQLDEQNPDQRFAAGGQELPSATERLDAFIIEEAEIVGIITERDYARKIVLMARSSKDAQVREIMSPSVMQSVPTR